MPSTVSKPYKLADRDPQTEHLAQASADDREYPSPIRDIPTTERPREKMMANGAQGLSRAELLAVIWNVGTTHEDVLMMARRTMHEYGEHAIPGSIKPAALAQQLSIPIGKACQLIAALQLGKLTYGTVRGGRPMQVSTPRQAYHYFRDMSLNTKEQLRGIYLDSRHHVIHDEIISIGSLTSNIVHPREVFQPALEYGAVALIIAHNHPSGSLEPSDADLAITQQLIAAGKILGVELLDHLIIAESGHQSVLQFLDV